MASGGAENLDGQLAQKAKPDNADPVSQLSFREPYCLERDTAERDIRGIFKRDNIGYFDTEVGRDNIVFRVRGVPAAAAGNAVAQGKAGSADIASAVGHDPGAGIPERHGRVEPGLGQSPGFHQALGFDFVNDLPDPVRPGERFSEKAFLGYLDHGFFRAHGHERSHGFNQKPFD